MTGFKDNMSRGSSILYFPFLPHQPLLPRISAFIHHGGAGTSAVSLAAGVPQLIVPRLPMQRDFGTRLKLLGVGRIVSPAFYRANRVAKNLSELIHSPAIRQRCQKFAEQLRHDGADGARVACDAMEILHREAGRRTTPDFTSSAGNSSISPRPLAVN
jgi:UDP:flavonoid glycosyltransferase YjiC (YdhE family)